MVRSVPPFWVDGLGIPPFWVDLRQGAQTYQIRVLADAPGPGGQGLGVGLVIALCWEAWEGEKDRILQVSEIT